ncbi:1-acyl-sn-glycerol-3-phosphate acyltransferase [Ectobacillus sp. JY-23]|uniref:lysophospholipid acyltransferase family protein n=1 Tax=Ectobacillus sp. JY-23 TaxID=2933872 RepID=UPI001FF3613C|nr:lysophospholipid acyltransferase family protein [Ectobacillus sp. JY-23]UOY92860.1 1-acyl-sn-glycerol-3-phosphate acyltransferase [Ectobacillus sp. JY-23]
MVRTVFAVIYIVLLVLGTLPRLSRMKKLAPTLSPEEKDRLVHKTPDSFGKGMIKASGSTVEVKGLEHVPDRAVLVVCNHQSNFDIPVLMGYLNKPIGFISKVEIKKLPIVSTWMELMNSVFMDRSDRRQSLQAIKDGIELLKNGHSLVIFPEGTRSKGKEMGEFKTGSFHLAVKSGVPILPVTVNGTYNILEANHNKIKPAHVTLTISEPIYEEQYKDMDLKELAAYTQHVIASKL